MINFQQAVDGDDTGANQQPGVLQDVQEPEQKRRRISAATATIGIPMTPEAALRKALTSVHPFDEATAVPGP